MKKQYQFLVREYAKTKLSWESIKVARNVERAKQRGLTASLTDLEWLQILYHFNFKCAFSDGRAETMEHIRLVRKGGGTERYNVVPACGKCNNLHDKVLQNLDRKLQALKSIDWGEV